MNPIHKAYYDLYSRQRPGYIIAELSFYLSTDSAF